MKSIRTYLLSRLVLGTALVLALAGVGVDYFVADALDRQFSANLVDRLQGLGSLMFQVGDQVEFEFSDELMPEYDREEAAGYFQVWYEDGSLLERSNSLGASDLLVELPVDAERHVEAVVLPDGRPGRLAVQRLEIHHVFPEEGPARPRAQSVTIAVARGTEDLVAGQRIVYTASLAVGVGLLLLIGCLAWVAVGRGLEPAERLGAALDSVQLASLPATLDVGEPPAELAPVVEKTNALLGRVDRALEREKRTAADIAHELRTPITEMLTAAEVALRNGHGEGHLRETLASVRDISSRMGRSVSTLLKLSQLEMGGEPSRTTRVEVGQIVSESLRGLAAVAAERGLAVRNEIDPTTTVEGDEDVLRIVLTNLLANAVAYTSPGGRVACRWSAAGAGWRLEIENDAPDLTPADMEVLAEPFWRKQTSRTDRQHSGLGLALSHALAARGGLELRLDLTEGVFRAELAPLQVAADAEG